MFHKSINEQEFIAAAQLLAGVVARRFLETPGPIAALAAQLAGPQAGTLLNGLAPVETDPVMTRKDAARTLKVCVNTIRKFEAEGMIHPIHSLRPSIRYRREEVLRLVDKRR